MEPRRLARLHELAPLPAEVLRHGVAGRQRRLERRAERRGEHADEQDQRARPCRARAPTGKRHLRQVVDGDAPRGAARSRRPPSARATARRRAGTRSARSPGSTIRSLRVHCSSTAPDEKKNTSYGVIAAPSSAIAKKKYVGRPSSPAAPPDASPRRQSMPVGVRAATRATAITTSSEPHEPEDLLHRREPHPPDHEPRERRHERDPQRGSSRRSPARARAPRRRSPRSSVRKLMKKDARRFTSAARAPSRSRTRSKTGRFDTAATRPAISAYTTMPTTPTTTAHASDMPKRAPVSAFATMSPMSTNPPNAVRMPRKISKTCLSVCLRGTRRASSPHRARRASACELVRAVRCEPLCADR